MEVCKHDGCNHPPAHLSAFCSIHHAENLAKFGAAALDLVNEALSGIVTAEVTEDGTGKFRVRGVEFTWRILETEEFAPLHSYGVRRILVLRISGEDGFDLAVRINAYRDESGHAHSSLGPAMALAPATPTRNWPAPINERISLRPKLTGIPNNQITGEVVGRLLQWLTSSRFRPHKCSIW